MNITNKKLILIFALLMLVCVAAIVVMQTTAQTAHIAEIYRENELLYSVDLDAVTESYTIDLGTNTVRIENGRICMESADCPDKLCVKRGAVSTGALPIVCLPNKIYVTVTGGGSYDAVSG